MQESTVKPTTADVKIVVDGKEHRMEGVHLKIEPTPELLKALQDMGSGTKELGDTIQGAGKLEVGAIYSAGWKDGALAVGAPGLAVILSIVICWLFRRKP